MIDILSIIIGPISVVFLIISAVALLRSKDLFTMIQIIKIANFYVFPLILIAIGLDKFSISSVFKIAAIIILNLVISHLLCYSIARKAMSEKVTPDAKLIKKSF